MSDKSVCYFCGDLATTDIRRVSHNSLSASVSSISIELCPTCFERAKKNEALTITKRKFEIKNDKDYHQFLVGKCLALAEDLALDDQMMNWVTQYQTITSLELKIDDMKKRIDGDLEYKSGVW